MKNHRIKMQSLSPTVREVYNEYLTHCYARGYSKVTIQTYTSHIRGISKHLDINIPIDELTIEEIDAMIVAMRDRGLAQNTIASYVRALKAFLTYCSEMGYCNLEVKTYKQVETVKQTYTDEELKALLKRPNKNCSFGEFRSWIIIQFLLNCGCRASTVRNILIKDLDLESRQVVYRHTKTNKVQILPLSLALIVPMKQYLKIRKGEPEDYLFCDEYGNMLTDNALKLSIKRYNLNRGVSNTSIHSFRHTFARKYLLDCNGDAFTLQKLLGHSTLEMTKHYCAIYDKDILSSVTPLDLFSQTKIK